MKIPFTIICFFFTLKFFGQVNDADAFFTGNYDKGIIHKQNVKQVLVETYINGNKSLLSNFEFDRNGFLTQEIIYDSSGKKVNGYFFTYNKKGDQIQRKNEAFDLNKIYVTSFIKFYNVKKLIRETSNDLPFVTTYMYDKKGLKIQTNAYFTPDTTTSAKRVSMYIYDTKEKLMAISDAYYESKSSLPLFPGKTLYLYDTLGRITEIIRENKATYYFSYNVNGLLKTKSTKMKEEFSNLNVVEIYSYTFWR